MQKAQFFLGARPLQAALETLCVGIVLFVLMAVLGERPAVLNNRPLPILFLQAGFTFVGGPLCMLWLAVRLKRFSLPRWQRYLLSLLLASALGLILHILAQEGTILLFQSPNAWTTVYDGVMWIIAAPFFDCLIFCIAYIGVRMWLFWDRLRRTQLVWALAHAMVVLMAMGAGLLILLVDIVIFYRLPVITVLPVTMILVVVSLGVLVALIPPFALFSYLAMRGTVQRVKMLATATGALRAGNYHVRVPVIGKDEIAQLQINFNAMATELQRSLGELQEQRDNVTKLLNERRELIANVSHELRTPVATLRGYLETLLIHWDGISRLDIHRDLHVMEEETVRLQGLVEDLFTLSRAEVGRLEMHCVPIDVGELVQRVVASSAPLAWRSSKIELVADIPDCLPRVSVDAKRLEQILHNLLHNGVRHTSPGGIVAVMVQIESETVAFQVRDTGEGIALSDLPHIWKRFYQSKSSLMGGGTGLGLALVKEWTEEMGGTVAIESILGEGSCFTIRFPASTLQPLASQNPLTGFNIQQNNFVK